MQPDGVVTSCDGQNNGHLDCFSANSLNRGFRYNEPISLVSWHFVKSRFHSFAYFVIFYSLF